MEQSLAAELTTMLQTDGLPGILVAASHPWRTLSEQAIAHLARTQPTIFVRHGQLVRIQRKEDQSPYIETLTETTLKGILARSMNFVKLTTRHPAHCPPPDAMVKDILTVGNWPFPALDSIIEFPVVRPDGTLISTPGYDAATQLYYAPIPELAIPAIPEHPTPEDVVAALALLDEVIGDFQFVDQASKDNALALLLTPLIRQAIAGHVPLAIITAPQPGTGKSLLAETVALIATGRKAAMMTAPYDDTEWRKRIAATLSEGATIITIDNVRARLQAASLDAALTSHTVKERILGESRNGVYAQRATWMATGNNVQVGGDLARRCYWIRMDARNNKPWTRDGFKHDLETWVPAHRGQIIAALLTLVRAWYDAGQPPMPTPVKLGSFQSWVNTMGGILGHTGMTEHFLGNLQQFQEQDEGALQWAAFLHAWAAHYQDRPVLAADLTRDLKAGQLEQREPPEGAGALFQALPDDLIELHKGDFKRRLGKALASRVGTRFDDSGLHLVKGDPDRRSGALYWSVAGASPPPAKERSTNT